MKFSPAREIKNLLSITKELDRKVIIIFIAVAVLQTVSWYYTSRNFFRSNIYFQFIDTFDNIDLAEYLYWFLGDFIVLLIIPLLIIKFIHHEKIRNYGVKFGDWRTGFLLTFVFLFFMIPILWFVSASPEFSKFYPHLRSAKLSWSIFIIYELGMFIYLFAWEFIWRGYMLFGLEERFGYYAVLMQMIPFVILHNGKPPLETFSAILGGIVLGILALRTRSFLYGVFVHFGIMLSIDLFSVIHFKTTLISKVLSSLF